MKCWVWQGVFAVIGYGDDLRRIDRQPTPTRSQGMRSDQPSMNYGPYHENIRMWKTYQNHGWVPEQKHRDFESLKWLI